VATRTLGARSAQIHPARSAAEAAAPAAAADTAAAAGSAGGAGAKRRTTAHTEEIQASLRSIVIYLAFLILFTFETARGLNDSDIYRTGNNFVSQLVSVEIPQRFSHVRKTYRDIATIQDLNEWLRGPFVSAVFSTKTVDGHADSASLAGSPLGYNKILGAVRVAQLRASEYDCTESMPRDLARQGGSYRWTCYGDRGQFSAATEAREPFGNYSSWDHANASRTAKPLKVHGPFAFNGRNGRTGDALHLDVLGKRTNVNNFISRTWKTYPSPAFAVMLDPTMGEAAAQQVMNDLVRSRYVDLSTKALLVDMAVYNPMVDRVVWVRLIAEMTKSAGVQARIAYEVVRLWSLPTSRDALYKVLSAAVAAFYAYFLASEVRAYRLHSTFRDFFSSPYHVLMVMNIVLYVMQWAFRAASASYMPAAINVDDPSTFLDFWPATRLAVTAVAVQAMNIFLSWFKLIQFLSIAPTFAVLNDTIARSAAGVGSFTMIFSVLLFGFAMSHGMVFGGRLEGFATLGATTFTLLRSLLGDFNFDDMQSGHSTMGPLFFVVFIVLCVFIVMNMFIAIISDAYSETKEAAKRKPDVNLSKEISQYVWASLVRTPVLGRYLRRGHAHMRRASMTLGMGLTNSEMKRLRASTESSPMAASRGLGPSASSSSSSAAWRRPSFGGSLVEKPSWMQQLPSGRKHSLTPIGNGAEGGGGAGGGGGLTDESAEEIARMATEVKSVSESVAAMAAAVQKIGSQMSELHGHVQLMQFDARHQAERLDELAQRDTAGLILPKAMTLDLSAATAGGGGGAQAAAVRTTDGSSTHVEQSLTPSLGPNVVSYDSIGNVSIQHAVQHAVQRAGPTSSAVSVSSAMAAISSASSVQSPNPHVTSLQQGASVALQSGEVVTPGGTRRRLSVMDV
jgi:hypothetical protein